MNKEIMNSIKNKILTTILSAIMLFSVVGFFACGTSELNAAPKNCEVIVESTLYGKIDSCNDFITICNTLDEFKQKCLSNGYDFFDSSNQGDNFFNTDVGESIREYTDEYFEDKAFLVCAFYNSSWLGQYRIDEVEVISGKLTLYLKYPINETANEVLNKVFLIAGVDKLFVSNITAMDYALR